MCFLDIDFSSLFFDFSWFWLDFGRPRGLQKSIKNRKNRVRGGFGTRLGSGLDFGNDFGPILMDIERILGGISKKLARFYMNFAGLTLMIRATRGRSSRPNHMLSLLDALQTLRPVDLRRLPRQFHSVAKRASLYIAFGTDFQGFWKPKWLPNSIFEALFFDVIFQCFWASKFGGFLEAPN